MLAFLGNALDKVGCVVAVLVAVGAIALYSTFTYFHPVPESDFPAILILLSGATAVPIWLFGRICRYALAGN